MAGKQPNKKSADSAGQVVQSIVWLRGHKVLLDTDLAELYGVPTKVLVQAVKRNIERFPNDFMFQLTTEEASGRVLHPDISEWVSPARESGRGVNQHG